MQNLKNYLIYESAGLFKGQLDLTNIFFLNILYVFIYKYFILDKDLNGTNIIIYNKDIPDIDCFFEKAIFKFQELNGDLAFDEGDSPYDEKTKKLKYIIIYINSNYIKQMRAFVYKVMDKESYENIIDAYTKKNSLAITTSDSQIKKIMINLHSSLIHELNHAYNHYNTYFKNSKIKINDPELVDKYIKRGGFDKDDEELLNKYLSDNIKKNIGNVSFYVDTVIKFYSASILHAILYETHPVETKAFNSMLISFKKFYNNDLEEAKKRALDSVSYKDLIYYKKLLTDKKLDDKCVKYFLDDPCSQLKQVYITIGDILAPKSNFNLNLLKSSEYQTYEKTYCKAEKYLKNNTEDLHDLFIKHITNSYNEINETNLSSNKVVKKLLDLIEKTTKKTEHILNKIFNDEIIDSNKNEYIYDLKNYKLIFDLDKDAKWKATDMHLLINDKEYKPIYTFKNKKITKK